MNNGSEQRQLSEAEGHNRRAKGVELATKNRKNVYHHEENT